MRALIYILLIAAVLWSGLAWESAHAPVALAPEAREEAAVPETPAPQAPVTQKQAEATVEAAVVSPPGALVGSQAVLPKAPAGQEDVEYDEAYVEALEVAIHARINEERKLAGLDLLAYDEVLAQVAAYHSTDMAKEDYFAHEDEDDCNVSCRVNSAGYKWRMVGENLFLLERGDHFSVEGASAIIVAGWMGSEGHRKNILQGKFTYEGIGVVVKGDAIYATEVFALPR